MTEVYDQAVLISQRDAAEARAAAAEAVARRITEDARLLLEPLVKLPAGTFMRRPHLFRAVFGSLVSTLAEGREP